MDRFPKGIVFGGACILGLTVALGWGGVNMIIKGQVKKEIRIINKTDTYRAWKDFPLPVYLSVYFFNITNAEDVNIGKKPIVQEVGPYVYLEELHKTDVSQNITNEIYTFRQLRFYHFQPDMSTGNEGDVVTVPNVPLLGLARIGEDLNKTGTEILKLLDDLVSNKGEMLTVTHSVKDLLFDGFPVNQYSSLVKENTGDPEIDESASFTLPESFSEEKFGFYKNRNGTGFDGLFEVRNGRNYSYQFGQVISYNEEYETPWWKEPCNRIHGSDGLSFHPFINTSTPLYTFEPTYCRTLSYNYVSSSIVQEVSSMRFVLDPKTFQGPHTNPANWCYCTDNSTSCDRNGVYDLSPCYEGIPFLLSRPHFMDADSDIMNGVEGLNPNPEAHESFLEMHSMSGIPLKTAKRFQFNIEIMPYAGIPALGEIPKTVVPIYWIQESVEAGAVHFLVFKIIASIQNGWDMLKYGLVGIGAFILFAGLVMGMLRKSNEPDRMVLVK